MLVVPLAAFPSKFNAPLLASVVAFTVVDALRPELPMSSVPSLVKRPAEPHRAAAVAEIDVDPKLAANRIGEHDRRRDPGSAETATGIALEIDAAGVVGQAAESVAG